MDTSSDGPSGAAQRAQSEDPEPSSPSFWQKLFGTSADPEGGETAGNETPATTSRPTAAASLARFRVEDVAQPKSDIDAVPVDIPRAQLVKVFRQSGYTRLPVFDGTLDTPLGFVNLKDFALKYGFNTKGGPFDIHSILRPLIYVPPSMPLNHLLPKMQAERTHMALVIDEYGGTDGLVTIEDLLEILVGTIEDEHDTQEADTFVLEKPGIYIAQSVTPLDDFEKATGVNLTDAADVDEEEVDTLGGVVFMLAGHVPLRGELIRHPNGTEFEVLEADARRIKRLRVILPETPETNAA